MAAYAQTTNFRLSITRIMEIWSNTINEIMIAEIMDLIDTEFAAMETAGLAGYTVTTGLEATMLKKISNMSNNTMKLCLEDFVGFLVTEFGLVETNGLAYEVTDGTQGVSYGIVRRLRQAMYNWPNSTHQIGMNQIIDLIATELAALETAS